MSFYEIQKYDREHRKNHRLVILYLILVINGFWKFEYKVNL